MRNRVDLVEDVVEHGDEQIYQQNIGNQEIHGHRNRRYPVPCNPISSDVLRERRQFFPEAPHMESPYTQYSPVTQPG